MKKREVRKLINRSISDGHSKQDTFDDLKEVSTLPLEDLAQLVQRTSSLRVRKKYQIYNFALIILLSLTVAIRALSALPIILEKGILYIPALLIYPAINIFLLWSVASFQHLGYRLVLIFSFLGLPRLILLFFTEAVNIIFLFDFAFVGTFIFLGLFLNARLFPNYRTKKEIYQNQFGENRMRYVFQFDD